MMTNKLPVPIAELPSPSALESKRVLHPEAILMSPSVVPHAAQQGNRALLEVAVSVVAVLEIEATDQPHARCFLRNAPLVAKTPKCLLNPAKVGQSTVQIVTAKRTQ
jgi:hypothetical protein